MGVAGLASGIALGFWVSAVLRYNCVFETARSVLQNIIWAGISYRFQLYLLLRSNTTFQTETNVLTTLCIHV